MAPGAGRPPGASRGKRLASLWYPKPASGRPDLVTSAGFLMYLNAAGLAFAGLWMVLLGSTIAAVEAASPGFAPVDVLPVVVQGAIAIGLAVPYALIARSLLKGHDWARLTAVVLVALILTRALLGFWVLTSAAWSFGRIVNLAMYLIIAAALLAPSSAVWFKAMRQKRLAAKAP